MPDPPAASSDNSLALPQAALAKQHHEKGRRFYDLAEYESALREFKDAYRAVDDPAFLFNIAQCHRKLGHAQDAMTFYRTYLRRAPSGTMRREVEQRIAELEREAAATPAPAPAATTPPPPAPPAPSPDLTPKPRPAAAPPADGAMLVKPAADAAEGPPVYTRGWFWIVTGVALTGAVVATILLARSSSGAGPLCPDCATTAGIDPR